MAHEGEALGRVDGRVVFAAFGIPGEDVRVRVHTEKKQFLSGDVSEVITPSEHRVTPRCPHFGTCGGCQLQHVAYEQQLVLKQRVVEEALRRIGKLLDVTVHPTLPSPQPWQYRNHARFSVTRDGRAGFTLRNTHRFVPVDWCYIVDPWINRAKDAL
jgi:23S rRNA (uracil1939-C5)-methyltransferase